MFSSIDSNFILAFSVNTISVIVLVFGCYLRSLYRASAHNHRTASSDGDDAETSSTTSRLSAEGNAIASREHALSYLLFSVGVFIVTYVLHSVEISMGFAFGLFAVFTMLRYRTESISVKEMTYLFLVIAISLLSAVGPLTLPDLAAMHAIIIASAFFWELILARSRSALLEQTIQYEKIENIVPENHQALIDDLKRRTGLDIAALEIIHIDFLRDTARLRVFYRPDGLAHKTSSTEPIVTRTGNAQ